MTDKYMLFCYNTTIESIYTTMALLTFLFLACQFGLGLALLDLFDRHRRFFVLEEITFAAIAGSSVSSFFILMIALAGKSLPLALWIFLGLMSILFYLRRHYFKGIYSRVFGALQTFHWRGLVKNMWVLGLLGIVLVYWGILYTILLPGQDGTLRASVMGWGDTALHIDTIQYFAQSEPFTLQNPLMGGPHLTYSFLINFMSAVLMESGASFLEAFRLPIFIVGTSSILLLFSLARRLVPSKGFAVLALVLVLCGSGLGFTVFFQDAASHVKQYGFTNVGEFFQNAPHEYTHLDTSTGGKRSSQEIDRNIVWIVPVISFLGHQRSFVLGLGLFLITLLGIICYGHSHLFWRFGLLAGLLPFSHIHTFLALFLAMSSLFWFYLKNTRAWLGFAAACSLLAMPQVLYFRLSPKLAPDIFLKHSIGWMTPEGKSVAWFLVKNFGVIFLIWAGVALVILAVGILARRRAFDTIHPSYLAATAGLFIIPNLYLFQAWSFDNNKVFFYWWILAILAVVTPFLAWLWQKGVMAKSLVAILVGFSVLAGCVDIISRFAAPVNLHYAGYVDGDTSKVTAAMWIRQNTPPNSLFLTTPSIDPFPLFLAGRPVYLTYEGWLWSWGLQSHPNRQIAQEILLGNVQLACQEKIGYIVLDNETLAGFHVTDSSVLFELTTTVFSQTTPGGRRYILKVNCQ